MSGPRRSPNPLPAHRYVPGQTPRHSPGAFDAVRAAVPEAWPYGLDLIEAGFFWEAHEVLEPVWMAQRPNSPERHLVQALIQLANAALKQAMGRDRAAARLCALADGLAARAGDKPVLDVEPAAVRAALARLVRDIEAGRIGAVRLGE